MAETKTKPTEVTPESFIEAVDHPGKREDGKVLDALFRKVTGMAPRMWGPTIVGYGEYTTVYESGRKVNCPRTGFSPRKAKHSLYVSCNCDGAEDPAFTELVGRMGKHSRGNGGCLYVNKLADIDLAVLEQMIEMGWKRSFENWPQ